MNDSILPMGTASGPGWQYRLERAGLFTPWKDWTVDPSALLFDGDPDGFALRIDTTYWLHGRNVYLPAGVSGSVTNPMASPIQLTASGRTIGVGHDGTVAADSGRETLSDRTDLFIEPLDGASGPGWQYRLERADYAATENPSTPWRDWQAEAPLNRFTEDPDGGAFHADVTYWFYARSSNLPTGEPGSVGSDMVAGLQFTPGGQVVGVTPSDRVPVKADTPELTLNAVLQRGANSVIIPFFEGGISLVLPTAPVGADFDELSIAPDGTVHQHAPTTLDDALRHGSSTTIMPIFDGGIQAQLPTLPPDLAHRIVAQGADGTIYAIGEFAQPTPLTVVSVDELYALVADAVTVLPNLIGRFDFNTCNEAGGWFLDTNNLNIPQQVRIECDGSIVATITCSLVREDVRDNFLIPNGYPTQATVFGWSFTKPTDRFRDGRPHRWKFYGGTTNIAATTDVNAPEEITCGTVANLPPTVTNPMPDVLINTPGAGHFDCPADQFSNDDGAVDKRAYKYDGGTNQSSGLPAGLTFDKSIGTGRFSYSADFPNQAFPIRMVGVDAANQSSPDDLFLLTVNRVAATPTIDMVAHAFQKNNPSAGNPSNLDVYVKTNSALQISYSYNSASGLPQSAYTTITQTGNWNGYNYRTSNVGVYSGLVVTLHFRVVGSNVDLLVITLPALPNSDFPFSQDYPNNN